MEAQVTRVHRVALDIQELKVPQAQQEFLELKVHRELRDQRELQVILDQQVFLDLQVTLEPKER